MQIGVQMFAFLMEAKMPSKKAIEAATNTLLKTETNYICEKTGRTLLPETQMKSCKDYGGVKVFFSKEDVAAIKHFREPGNQCFIIL